MGSRQYYFSIFIAEYPKETADITKKELNMPTTTNSSIYLPTHIFSVSLYLIVEQNDTAVKRY